jgi:hypothetical protein
MIVSKLFIVYLLGYMSVYVYVLVCISIYMYK